MRTSFGPDLVVRLAMTFQTISLFSCRDSGELGLPLLPSSRHLDLGPCLSREVRAQERQGDGSSEGRPRPTPSWGSGKAASRCTMVLGMDYFLVCVAGVQAPNLPSFYLSMWPVPYRGHSERSARALKVWLPEGQ